MYFQIIYPTEALRPYISRYVFVRAEGSTDTMAPPSEDPRFVNGKHVQPLLPNYGSFIFVRNAVVEIGGKQSGELMLLGANQTTLGLTTLSGWFEGMMLDFEPGGMHVLTNMDLQSLSGKVLTAHESGDEGLMHLDQIFRSSSNAKGNISAAEMASVACLGERQFLRVFRNYVGIPPKQFVRLRRFHCTLQDMQLQASQGASIDLLATVMRHGYYDLSHAALEFQQMGCVSPGQFRMLGIPLTQDFSVFFA